MQTGILAGKDVLLTSQQWRQYQNKFLKDSFALHTFMVSNSTEAIKPPTKSNRQLYVMMFSSISPEILGHLS